jgi:hypothetical protein
MNLLRSLFALMLLVAGVASAEATIVVREGRGEAAVVNKDEPAAFEAARQQALRDAVEQAAGVRIDADTVAVNNQLVRDQVFANTSGYVKKFELLDRKLEKGVVTVRVKADVITDHLDRDLQAARDLVRRAGRPRLVVLIQEQTITADGKTTMNSNTLATVLSEAFKADGYDLKDPAFAAGKVRVGAAIGPAEVKEIGDLSKAQFILYGTASFRHQVVEVDGQKTGMLDKAQIFPVTGEYDLSLFSTDDGSVITKVSEPLRFAKPEQAGQHALISYEYTSMALVKVRKAEIAAGVRRGILEHLRDQFVNGRAITMTVGGLESFGAAKDFRKSMDALKGMKDTVQDGFAGGKASYRVTYLGNAQELAEQLESSTFKRRKLSVLSVSSGAVEVQVAR